MQLQFSHFLHLVFIFLHFFAFVIFFLTFVAFSGFVLLFLHLLHFLCFVRLLHLYLHLFQSRVGLGSFWVTPMDYSEHSSPASLDFPAFELDP